MERTPQKAPLPCFGLEHERFDPTCQACPHKDGCVKAMGARYDMVPLNRVRWNIVPAAFASEALDMDDPEIPHLRRLYTDCYYSVFHRKPPEDASRFADDIKKNAAKVPCSVRMFILANMVAQREHEKQIVRHTEKLRGSSFRAKMLTGELAIKRAKTYQEMCHDEFGTFSLTSLSVLAKEDLKESMDDLMLRSEATAAAWFVRYKIFNGGSPNERLYESEELQLAPEWLAIEQTYIDTILKPYIERKITGSDAVERHRFNAFQVHCQFKKNISLQRVAWVARQRIMPEAVRRVLATFDHQPADFLYPREPETEPMHFWMRLALTIRHYHCWLYLNGEPSFFTPRRNEALARRS
jgi:hypothetical protein